MSKTLFSIVAIVSMAAALPAADQTVVGAGNPRAEQIAAASLLVRTAHQILVDNAQAISDPALRQATLDAFNNPSTCVYHRIGVDDAKKTAMLTALVSQGLINPADAAGITGGMKAGVFPPILAEGSPCPHLPMLFDAAPGSAFHGHHSYPGGLPIHEANNDESFLHFADLYRGSYDSGKDLPSFGVIDNPGQSKKASDGLLDEDLVLGAPIWHDWAKPMVFQWNADGAEFTELNFGGNGTTDSWGAAGDSRTGGHHIMSIAESMKRGLSPAFVITQASAHSAPTSGNEYKVVNWLRAAAILAQIDPVAKGYLRLDGANNLRLPVVRELGNGVDLNAEGQTNLLEEYALHNLSDSDFNLSGPVVSKVEVLLATLAPSFGYSPADVTNYNTKYRNVVLSQMSAEHLAMIYEALGLSGVKAEVQKLKQKGVI